MPGGREARRRCRSAWTMRLGLLLGLLLLGACKVEVYGQLSEREATEMAAILIRAGIPAERALDKARRASLHVEEARFAEAVEILKANGYPRAGFATLGELFKKDGMISSPTEERARLIYALSQELASTISSIDGVLSARVHVVLPEADPLRRAPPPSSASVFIRHHRAADLGVLVPQIKMLVANGIEGLVYDKVSVALFPVDSGPAVAGNGQGERNYLTHVAGLWVHEASADWARLVLTILTLTSLIGIGATLMLVRMWRRRVVIGVT